MDLQYLLSLQSFRETAGQWLAPLMSILSKTAEYGLLLIPILIFWNAGREEGYWYLLNLGLSDFVNNLMKLTACVYRPWIRDSRIVPWGDAITGATGYSFPSGHTVGAASVLGSVCVRQWRRRRWLAVISVIFTLLIGFSRNYLGVHTPQDVLVGLAETCLILWFTTWLFRHLRGNEKLQDICTFIGFGIAMMSLVYFRFKPYPLDEVDGVLLVDPQAMMKDAYMSVGTLLGFLAGSWWERKRIRYDSRGTRSGHILRSVIGVAPALLIYLVLRKALEALLGVRVGNLLGMALLALFVTGIFPWCVMRAKAWKAERAGSAS